jgi:hypothetical protein
MTSFFRFVDKWAIYRWYNLIRTCAGECDWLFHWEHKLCAIFSANVNINYCLPIKVTQPEVLYFHTMRCRLLVQATIQTMRGYIFYKIRCVLDICLYLLFCSDGEHIEDSFCLIVLSYFIISKQRLSKK